MKLRNIILLTSILLFSSNCSLSNSSKNYGYISMSVKFPDKRFSIKVIPVETYIILVEINGENMTETLSFNLTKTNPSRTVIAELGNKEIKVTAFDVNGKILAKGKNTINILSKFITYKAEIILTPVSTNESNINNSGSSSGTINNEDTSFTPVIIIGTNKPGDNPVTPSPSSSVQPTASPSSSSRHSSGGGGGVNNLGNVRTDIEIVDGEPFNGDVTITESTGP